MGIKRLLIVGGVAGGASCAARARRLSETAEIVVFDRGDYVSFANCGLPYFVGNVIKKEESLQKKPVKPIPNPMMPWCCHPELFPSNPKCLGSICPVFSACEPFRTAVK